MKESAVAMESRAISSDRKPRRSSDRRRRTQNMRMTADHPMPISSLLAPVTFAATRDISLVTSPVAVSKDWPASHASTASMAYSGRMAIRARTAMARAAETSC